MRIGFGLGFLLFPQLPLSLVVVLFALYICMTGFSYLITYCYYRKERVNGRLVFLIASVVLLVVGIPGDKINVIPTTKSTTDAIKKTNRPFTLSFL